MSGSSVDLGVELAVLASPREVAAVGAAVALAAARLRRSGAAVLCRWPPADGPAVGAPSLPRASRLAGALAARDVEAAAAGRLVLARLPGDAREAAVSTARVAAATGAVPVVLTLAARDAAFDALLSRQDGLVLALEADADADLAGLALEELSRLGPPVVRLETMPARGARIAALGGVAAPREVQALVAGLLG